MKFSTKLIFAAAIGLAGQAFAIPLVAHPGNAGDIIITEQNTLNATAPAPSNMTVARPMVLSTAKLDLCFVNKLSGAGVNAYVTGLDRYNRLVMLTPGGGWYYPAASGSTTPVPITANVAIPLGGTGSRKTVTLPDYISSGRVWFAVGTLRFFTVQIPGQSGPSLVTPSAVNPSDPSAGISWGFVELTNTAESGLYANISYVDFVGLILGMILTTMSGATQSAKGLQYGAVASICSELNAQHQRDGRRWNELCVRNSYGYPLRVLAPTDFMSVAPYAFGTYWTTYIDRVWSTYAHTPLTINTQSSAGNVACRVSGALLLCAGDNRGYAKPTAADIFGCNSGPFAIAASDNAVHRAVVPRLCAAFHRSSFFVTGGGVQPGPLSSNYYTVSPTNYYSKIVHQHEVDGKGYAFAYDDVTPSTGINQSGELSSSSPKTLTISVGGPAT